VNRSSALEALGREDLGREDLGRDDLVGEELARKDCVREEDLLRDEDLSREDVPSREGVLENAIIRHPIEVFSTLILARRGAGRPDIPRNTGRCLPRNGPE
jgi:hypothetical protein